MAAFIVAGYRWRAVHIDCAVRAIINTAAIGGGTCSSIPGNAAAGHGEGTAIIYTAAKPGGIIGNGTTVHIKCAAVIHPSAVAVRGIAGNGTAI